MLNRRHAIVLTAKGLAALMAALPFLTGCAEEEGGEVTVLDEGPDLAGGGGPIDARAPAMDGRVGAPAAPGDPEPGASDASPDEDSGEVPDAAVDAEIDAEIDAAPAPSIDWESFLTDLAELAEGQFSPDWDQEGYVEDVIALMRLLDLDDAQVVALYENYVNATRDFPELTTAHDGGHFEVVIIQFEPGEHIPLHNHPDMTGVIFCLSGAIEIENFDLLQETSDDGNLLLRRTGDAALAPGDFATLTAERGNIHALTASEFTELLDVFTPPYDDARIRRYRWYERAEAPYDGDAVYEAWET